MELRALKMNPSMTPNTSSVVADRNRAETRTTRAAARNAPRKAASATVKPVKKPVETPRAIVAMAAPSPAPPLTPMMCGSASGLRKTACICAPDRASAPPARTAVSTLGTRSFHSTAPVAHEIPPPPTIRSTRRRQVKTMQATRERFITVLFVAGRLYSLIRPRVAIGFQNTTFPQSKYYSIIPPAGTSDPRRGAGSVSGPGTSSGKRERISCPRRGGTYTRRTNRRS